MKICIKCGETKALSEFYKHKASKDGLYSYCKICKKQHSRIRRQDNPEYYKQWREANPDYSKQWRESGTPHVYVIKLGEEVVYYGSSSLPANQRWSNHLSAARSPSHTNHNYPIYWAMRKYGIDKFTCEKLEYFDTIEEAQAREKLLIKLNAPKIYNVEHNPCAFNGEPVRMLMEMTIDDCDRIIELAKVVGE